MEAIQYDVDLNFLKSPEELAREEAAKRMLEQESRIPSASGEMLPAGGNVPVVDRTKKPKPGQRDPNINILPNNVPAKTVEKPDIGISTSSATNVLMPGNKKDQGISEVRISNNLSEPDKAISASGAVKDTNVRNQGKMDVPAVPSVNRNLKPNMDKMKSNIKLEGPTSHTDPSVATSPSSAVGETTSGEQMKSAVAKKPEELASISTEGQNDSELSKHIQDNKRLILENQARLAKLNRQKAEMDKLKENKEKEIQETKDLLKMKSQVQEEIQQLEDTLQRLEQEEKRR